MVDRAAPEEIQAITKITKTEFSINWGVIKRALDVLLKLAPQELRSPPDYLDEIYDAKRKLRKVFEKEQLAKYEKELEMEVILPNEIMVTDEEECKNCYADAVNCGRLIMPGDERCIQRRARYNEATPDDVSIEMGEPERSVSQDGGPGTNKKRTNTKAIEQSKISDKKS